MTPTSLYYKVIPPIIKRFSLQRSCVGVNDELILELIFAFGGRWDTQMKQKIVFSLPYGFSLWGVETWVKTIVPHIGNANVIAQPGWRFTEESPAVRSIDFIAVTSSLAALQAVWMMLPQAELFTRFSDSQIFIQCSKYEDTSLMGFDIKLARNLFNCGVAKNCSYSFFTGCKPVWLCLTPDAEHKASPKNESEIPCHSIFKSQ